MNAVLKSKVDYKKSELPAFLEKLKSVIDEQEREIVERAVINRGKYQRLQKFGGKGGSLVFKHVTYTEGGTHKTCSVL